MAAVIVTEWTGRRADALRLACRETQEGFAERLGVSARQVGNWRYRPQLRLSACSAALLDSVLSAASSSTVARFAELTGEPVPAAAEGDLRAQVALLAARVDALTATLARLGVAA